MTPWNLPLLVARNRLSPSDRRSLARDADRGLLVRVRPGVYVERAGIATFDDAGRHVLRIRALAEVSDVPPVFALWSAALLHGLPTIGGGLSRVYVCVSDPSDRGLVGADAHVAPLGPDDAVLIGMLRSTSLPRTVVDIGLASAFRGGVVVADAALRAGARRHDLELAVVRAAERGRRGIRRAQDAVAFADGDSESANESQARVSTCELGIAPPILQHEVWDREGLAGRLDMWFEGVRAGGEADGDVKYRDPRLAPAGAAAAVIAEKKREDRVRRSIDGLARSGRRESCSAALLAPVLAAVGVVPATPRATVADYCTPFRVERLLTSAQIRDT